MISIKENFCCVKGIREAVERPALVENSQSRINIYLHAETVPSATNFKHLSWLIKAINIAAKDKDKDVLCRFPKIVIYFNSRANLVRCYEYFSQRVHKSFLPMMSKYFHGYGRGESDLEAIEIDFIPANSRIRLVMATKALGEGVDCKGLRLVLVQG